MIVYSNILKQFCYEVDTGIISEKILEKLEEKGISHNNPNEVRAWENSLLYMKNVLDVPEIPNDVYIAIEYNIPNTSKRVDFIISGRDDKDISNIVIVELKQWEKAEKTSRHGIVTTYLAGTLREVVHPAYQAYSYAQTIKNYNSYIDENNIKLVPSAYLHNYQEIYREEIDNFLYEEIIKDAPIFLKKDGLKLQNFIKKYIKKADRKELMYEIDHGKIKPSKALQDAVASMLKGNKEFYMIDEQKVAFETIKKLVELSLKTDDKYTIIVEGGPGTGKSVIAINLLAEFKNKLVNYVTKNAAPRNVFFSKLRQDDFKLNYINNLFKGSGSYYFSKPNEMDLLIVDEAHRLNEKSGLFQNKGENQVKEIINASRVSVFFIDEDQIVTTQDFGSVNEIKKQAKQLGSKLFYGENYNLVSQFRCNGSDGYLSFLDHVLQIRETANFDGFETEYDFRIYDDVNQMKKDLHKLNNNNKARMVAGYTYNWITKNDPNDNAFDIVLGDFKAKWNFNSTSTWAIDSNSFDQVGCIHTSQGLEFDYIGVIIGQDLLYRDNQVLTNHLKRAKTDASLKGIKSNNNLELADRIIRNTYKTLMSRGQKGCFIYCEDKNLSNYLKRELKRINKLGDYNE